MQARINIIRLFILSLISSCLLWLAWPPLPLNFVVLFAFVPLLLVEDNIYRFHQKRRGLKVFLLGYFSFLCWNIFTTYWIWYASPGGAIMAIVLNALLMSIPFLTFHHVKRKMGVMIGYISLVCFWLCLEMLHLNWDSPWPWLNLGNAFACTRNWVQWYEYTGTVGGSIWIWAVNILIYQALGVRRKALGIRRGIIISLLFTLFAPIIISYLIKPKNPVLNNKANAVAVQPNIDPYNDKFDPATYDSQINTLLSLSTQKVDSNTVLLAWPETAIAELVNERTMFSYRSINEIHDFLKKYPHLKLITGVNSYATYSMDEPHSITARMYSDKSGWYDGFNASFEMDHSDSVHIYHKFKLVPGVEKMPYPSVLGFLESYSISMGGPGGSLGSKFAPYPFKINDSLKVAPIICYESIFGEYVGDFIKNGADVLAIITNDGWWQNTPGYKQHLYTGALRAIETRKFIVRAANTGISCFILPSGDIIQPTEYWKEAVIKSPLYINHEITFYSEHGDYLGWAGVYIGGILFILLILVSIKRAFVKPN